MNTLSYRSTTDNGLSFELLVDGVTLPELLGDGNGSIPYWIVEDDLPYWPPHGTPWDPDYRIVTVCSCGEYGCGHSRCRVKKSGDSVAFSEFTGDVGPSGMSRVLSFSRDNYDAIVTGIVSDKRKQKRKEGESAAPPNDGPTKPPDNPGATERLP